MLCCIFWVVSRVLLSRYNWFKHEVLISRGKEYFHTAGPTFQQHDFSWREFAIHFTPLVGNWLRLTKRETLELISEIAECLNHLHSICDFMYDNIHALLSCSKFKNLDQLVEYLKDFSIMKYLREEDHYDLMLYQICTRLSRNCKAYPKAIQTLQNKLLVVKKIFPITKKSFLILIEK